MLKTGSRNGLIYNKEHFCIYLICFSIHNNYWQSIGFSPIVCFVALGFSSRFNKLHSKDHSKPKLRASMKNRSSFLFSSFPIFTRALIAFIRSANPKYSLHSVITSFKQYYCLSTFVNWVVAPSLSYQG